jgi:hypothetical protein
MGPVVTFTVFSGDFSDGTRTVRIASYVKRQKVPIWSTSELAEPVYNAPVEFLVRDVAAKISREFLPLQLTDEEVQSLITQANGADTDAAMAAIVELGFSNNLLAVPTLAKLTGHRGETLRAAALSGLGTLGAQDQLPLLAKMFETGGSTSDRYAALKAIGDLGSPEALSFLGSVLAKTSDKDRENVEEILDLYLRDRPAAPAPEPPASPTAVPEAS